MRSGIARLDFEDRVDMLQEHEEELAHTDTDGQAVSRSSLHTSLHLFLHSLIHDVNFRRI